ncbi:hypothetical protein SPRG_11989 [Saprolegnia parasitica CBS 223.65]|uniref:Uncharacterized protein n=1 Tax=Saprolegnia parasitica (strain CBS 223.65) TaxID=695850 RepID=A0A067C7R3_SAPPC|nr:hypothetical protein SPRG_11989 [Saprolegnia parasitica CBS 223.65]KDO22852.1 hypothetical protein SPRG_11989 [Saprolegnia parasitica CBS 223.65]|eukprot:XP_012206409.1 hypothetical protein SPRG_11989 [Saprolegnia parasitica CBS 223.65]
MLLRMPYAQYYSKVLRRDALALGAGTLAPDAFANVLISRYLGIPMAYTAFWAVNATLPNRTDVYVSMQLPRFPSSLGVIKLTYRIVLSAYIVWLMVRRYYKPYLHLRRNLIRYGLDGDESNMYEIVVGDATGVVLQSPVVSTAFLIDTLCSVDSFAAA